MLPTHFTITDSSTIQLPSTAMDSSLESVPGQGPSPFTLNDFTFFDELNHSLRILNPTDDIQAQLDQLISRNVPSGSAFVWPSTPDVNNIQVPGIPDDSQLFRIPAANEVAIKGVHPAPLPGRSFEKKLDESAWKRFANQIQLVEAVQHLMISLTVGNA